MAVRVIKRKAAPQSAKSSATSLVTAKLLPVRQFLSTGCTILDLAIAGRLPGGFGGGRISHIWGPESSAKSVLIAEPLGSAIRQGGQATLVDTEGTFDFDRAETVFGVDITKLEYISAQTEKKLETFTLSYMFDKVFRAKMHELKGNKYPSVVGVDSLSAMTSEREYEKDMDKASFNTSRAMDLSEGFRKYIWALNRSNLALLFIDQSRDKIGGFGGKTFSGGNALRFYASTRVYVEKRKAIFNKHKKECGIEVFFKVDKNKIAPPFRSGMFRLLWDYGIDDVGTSLLWLKENMEGVPEKQIPLPDGTSIIGLERAIHKVEDKGWEEKVRRQVYKVWQEVYSQAARKEKRRW